MLHSHTTVGQMAPVAVEHAREATAAHLTRTLRRSAHERGWPAAAYQGLSVKHHEGSFQVKVADHISEAVMDREYGNQASPPDALLRQFHNRIPTLADQAASHYLLSAVR